MELFTSGLERIELFTSGLERIEGYIYLYVVSTLTDICTTNNKLRPKKIYI